MATQRRSSGDTTLGTVVTLANATHRRGSSVWDDLIQRYARADRPRLINCAQMLRQLRLQNFRCFDDHTVVFETSVVVVGKNNAGKSSVIEALRILSTVVNRKGATFARAPQWLDLPRFQRGIAPGISQLGLNLTSVSIDTVHPQPSSPLPSRTGRLQRSMLAGKRTFTRLSNPEATG